MDRESKFTGSTHNMRIFLFFLFPPLTFTQGLFSLENSRNIWQVGLKMFMAVLMTSHLWKAVCAEAWGTTAGIFPGCFSAVLWADFGIFSFYMKKQMGERELLRETDTFLAQRYFKHKSAKRPHEAPNEISQGSRLSSGIPCCTSALMLKWRSSS